MAAGSDTLNQFYNQSPDVRRKALEDEFNISLDAMASNESPVVKLAGAIGSVFELTSHRLIAIGGDTGSGKTTLLDSLFLEPVFRLPKFYVNYFVGERGLFNKFLDWTKDGQGLTNRESVKKNKEALKAKFKKMSTKLNSATTWFEPEFGIPFPIDMYDRLRLRAEQSGKSKWKTVYTSVGATSVLASYQPNDPEILNVVALDHIGITPTFDKVTRKAVYLNKKVAIDDAIANAAELRDRYGYTFIINSQYNRANESVDRMKFSTPQPKLSDFKDSASLGEYADLVIGLHSPHRHDQSSFADIDTSWAYYNGTPHLRTAHVLKNSFGADTDIMLFLLDGRNKRVLPLNLPDRNEGLWKQNPAKKLEWLRATKLKIEDLVKSIYE